ILKSESKPKNPGPRPNPEPRLQYSPRKRLKEKAPKPALAPARLKSGVNCLRPNCFKRLKLAHWLSDEPGNLKKSLTAVWMRGAEPEWRGPRLKLKLEKRPKREPSLSRRGLRPKRR